jgi:hypothetical protein
MSQGVNMTNKIVYFPSPATAKGVERIKEYKSTGRTEILIAIWFCGRAILSAVECIRQMSSLAV